MAFLLLEPTITKATTILGFETYVKYLFRAEGCPVNVGPTFLETDKTRITESSSIRCGRTSPVATPANIV